MPRVGTSSDSPVCFGTLNYAVNRKSPIIALADGVRRVDVFFRRANQIPFALSFNSEFQLWSTFGSELQRHQEQTVTWRFFQLLLQKNRTLAMVKLDGLGRSATTQLCASRIK